LGGHYYEHPGQGSIAYWDVVAIHLQRDSRAQSGYYCPTPQKGKIGGGGGVGVADQPDQRIQRLWVNFALISV